MTSFDNNVPIKPTDFNPENHFLYDPSKIKAHANGGKYIYAKAKVKAPTMMLPFDANINEDEHGKKKYDISLSFLGSDTDAKIQTFLEMCKAADEYNIDWATKNSVELWGEDLTNKRIIVEDRYTNMVRMPKKAEYSPMLKVKLMTNYSTHKAEFQVFSNVKDPESGEFPEINTWDDEKEEINVDFFKAKSRMTTLIEYTGMWVVGKKLYPSWKLVQCQNKSAVVDKKFALDDSDDEGGQTVSVEDRLDDERDQFSED